MTDNELIAEFMGAKQVNMHTAIEGRRYSILTKNYPQTLKYHTSWEWLMPVVDKIELDTIHGNYIQLGTTLTGTKEGKEGDSL